MASKITLFRWKGTNLPLKLLEPIEKRKVLQGMINNRDYFIRLVLEKPEAKYDEISFHPISKIKVKGLVKESSLSIFTPCIYKVHCKDSSEKQISRLISYRGRFAEQLDKGDIFEVRGTLEEVLIKGKKRFYQIVLGDPEDYLLPISRI